jgi:hypothetical protein
MDMRTIGELEWMWALRRIYRRLLLTFSAKRVTIPHIVDTGLICDAILPQ